MEQNKGPWWIPFAAVVGVVLALSIAWPRLIDAQPVGQPAGPYAVLVTVTAGTPIQVSTKHIVISSLMAEPLVGTGNGIIEICNTLPGITPMAHCAHADSGNYELKAQLAAASTTIPGPAYGFTIPTPGADLSTYAVDGEHSGDLVLFTYYVHQ